MRRVILIAAAVVGAWAARSAAQNDGYTIKLRRETPGDKTEVTKVGAEAVKIAFTVMDQEQTKDEKKASKFVYTQEIVERPADAKRPTKLVRTYQTAEKTVDGKAQKLAYDGKKVTIEKKGTKYTFAIDGEDLAAADAEDLEKEFNKESESPIQNEDLMPKGPVKLNEEWVLEPARFIKDLEASAPFKLDPDKTKIAGKLTKVYQKGAARYGLIEVTLTLPTKVLKSEGQEIELKDGSHMTAKINLDVCIDGSATVGTGDMAMKIDIKADLPAGGSMVVAGNTTLKSTAKQVGKK